MAVSTDNRIKKVNPPSPSFWSELYIWKPTSISKLYNAELKVFSGIKSEIELFFIPINDGKYFLKTLVARNRNNVTENCPILMLHGMGAAIGLWCKNIDAIAEHRTVYAIDLLGFGTSSRCEFPKSADGVEEMYVNSFEEWRQQMNLESFILLGHSMGGYLAYAYSIKHANRVKHLILADPWGFSRYTEDKLSKLRQRWYMNLLYHIFKNQNPLGIIRFLGPIGPYILKRVRTDLAYYFYKNDCRSTEDGNTYQDYLGIFDYIYHCNAQNPTGEAAFRELCQDFGWAKYPMVERCLELAPEVGITFIYGDQSWMDVTAALEVYNTRNSYVNIKMIEDCGHHVYAEGSVEYNTMVNKVAAAIDKGEIKCEKLEDDLDNVRQNPRTYRRTK